MLPLKKIKHGGNKFDKKNTNRIFWARKKNYLGIMRD